MKKNLLFQLLLVICLVAIYGTASYGSDKFTEHYNKAIEYYKQGKYDQAGKQFENALDLKPNDAYALYGLGNTYYCKAKYDEAIKIYLKAIDKNPDYAKVHYSLSLAYNKMGMTREAEKEKKIFRKISQGEKWDKKSSTQVKTSRAPVKTDKRTSTTKRGRSGFGLTKEDKHDEQGHSGFGKTGQDLASKDGKAADTDKQGHSAEQTDVAQKTTVFSSKPKHVEADKRGHSAKSDHAAIGKAQDGTEHGERTASSGVETDQAFGKKHVTSTRGTKKHLKQDDTHSIFQGYTKESSQPKSHLFGKKQGKSYGYDISPVVYVKSKWTKSMIHKIFISVIGYVFVTQMWLSVIAFFGLIVWRIRQKNILG